MTMYEVFDTASERSLENEKKEYKAASSWEIAHGDMTVMLYSIGHNLSVSTNILYVLL